MIEEHTNGYVRSQLNEGIIHISFFHPAQNSLPGQLLAELADHITKAGENDDCRLIILKSEGERTFCAGASFTELASLGNPDDSRHFFMGFARVILCIKECPKLVIGRVQGKAVGGGVGLAAACDYCFATRYASIRLSELAVGIGPFVIGPAVQRKMGLSAFSQLALDADTWQPAEWAQQRGLYMEVSDSIEAMDTAIHNFTSTLLARNEEALKELKKIFWEGTDHWTDVLPVRASTSGRLILSDTAQHSIRAFLQK